MPVGDPVALDGRNSFDPGGDLITYSWQLVEKPAQSTAALNHPASVMPAFLPDQPGNYVVSLIVSNDRASSASDDVLVAAALANVAPTALAGRDQSVVTGSVVHLDGTASSDPNGDAFTYRWQFTSRPVNSAAAFDNSASATPSFVADKVGQYLIELKTNDGQSDSLPCPLLVLSDTPNAKSPTSTGTISFSQIRNSIVIW